ncbi:MAG: protein CoxF [Hyphomicrobium sp.]|nr:protein CoxF [Hyphomicrobium sp.]
MTDKPDSIPEASNELASQRVARRRSIAIALTLGVMVVLFYAATLVRLGGAVAQKTW